MFYTFVDRMGPRVFHRYIDDQGKRHEEVIKEFPIEIFTPGKTKDSVALDGSNLSRIIFTDIKEAQDFVKNYKEAMPIHGQTSWAHQFISYQYPQDIQFDMSKMVILNFDIEVKSDEGFPHPSIAKDPILSISMKVFGKDQFITLGLKPYNKRREQDIYVQCNNETHLLNVFLGFWKRIRPDILVGWNISGFDIPYIVNRMRRLLGEKYLKELSPFSAHIRHGVTEVPIKDGRGETTYRILGINTFDYMELYKKFNPEKLERYSLDFVGEHEGVGKKLDYSDYGNSLTRLYNENFQKFIEYNEMDVELVEKLDNKLEFIRLGISIAMMTKSRYSEIFGTVKIWDNLIYNMLKKQGIQIPPENFTKEAKDFIGGFVKEPKPGRYEWVVSLDLTSLYPSIIRMYNMSPETLVANARGTDTWLAKMLRQEPVTQEAKNEGCVMAANGTIYRQDITGVLPTAMTFVFDERKRVKKKMLEEEKKKQRLLKELKKAMKEFNNENEIIEDLKRQIGECDKNISALDAAQKGLKVVANGGYGATANTAFRYFNPEISEAITLTGQMTIQFIERKINEYINNFLKTENKDYVITMDTDSVYITLNDWVKGLNIENKNEIVDKIDSLVKAEIEPMLEKSYKELSEYVGANKNLMDMKREAIGDVGIFRGKKNYILQVYDNEGVRYSTPKLKMVGIETARSSTPRMVRNELTKCLDVIVNGTQEDLLKRIATFRNKFDKSPLVDIAYPRGVSNIKKWLSNGAIPYRKGTPIHVKAVIYHNKLIQENPELHTKYEQIKEGNKIKFIYLKEPNKLQSNAIAFNEVLPKEFGLDKFIDKDLQFEKCFLSPLKSFTDLVQWKVEKTSTLED